MGHRSAGTSSSLRMVEMMTEHGITCGRVGLVGRRFILSVGNYEILVDGLPNVEFTDADELMDRIRAVKSELEIQQIRELWTLSKASMERFVAVVEPGRTQRELAAEASAVALAGGARSARLHRRGAGGQPTPGRPRALRRHSALPHGNLRRERPLV
ncbi:MAG: hypothetical protein R2873_35410 [Caldilineaceae bacterium]